MGTLVVGTIIDTARRQLFELGVGQTTATDVQWDRTRELLGYSNSAEREIVISKADAFVRNEAIQLATGAKQALPAGGRYLTGSGIQHNMGSNGSTPGRPITIIDRLYLAQIAPTWMTDTGAYVQHYVYDQGDPTRFFIYPQVSGTWYVNASFCATPAAISAANIDSSAISVGDEYEPLIRDYIVGMALWKTFKTENMPAAAARLAKFYAALGRNFQVQKMFQPLDQAAQESTPDALGKA